MVQATWQRQLQRHFVRMKVKNNDISSCDEEERPVIRFIRTLKLDVTDVLIATFPVAARELGNRR